MIDNKKIRLAVFDFDGTLIPGQSGQKLAVYLWKTKKVSNFTALRLILWGLRYKAHLPHRQNLPRELIFKAFAGKKVDKVDKYIDKFFNEYLDKTVRKDLIKIAEDKAKEGCELVVVSAAFTPTIKSFAKIYQFEHLLGTSMEVDNNNCYTGNVDGNCVAGKKKIEYLKDFANQQFGEDGWEITYAFADHYTDKSLLKLAKYPCAVSPDDTLRRYAKKHKWDIIDYKDK